MSRLSVSSKVARLKRENCFCLRQLLVFAFRKSDGFRRLLRNRKPAIFAALEMIARLRKTARHRSAPKECRPIFTRRAMVVAVNFDMDVER